MSGALRRALVAGAAGSTALNLVGYADMALRGRPASRVPDAVAQILARGLGAELDEHRAEGWGMLLGYADGFAFALGYAFVHRIVRVRELPWGIAGIVLAAATFAPEFVAARLGATDPRTWGTRGWLEGTVPRLAYGLVTAGTYASLVARKEGDRMTPVGDPTPEEDPDANVDENAGVTGDAGDIDELKVPEGAED